MRHHRVLFVDDSHIFSMTNCEVLQEHGFDVVQAFSASDALLAIDQHPPLAALVTDIDLGDGADGFEVARRARLAYPQLPVVFISGTAAARHAAEGVEGSAFIGKPCDPLQILELLDRVIQLEAA